MDNSPAVNNNGAPKSDGEVHDDVKDRRVSAIIGSYLRENCIEFQRLADLREEGWKSSRGDAFFEKQRRLADSGRSENFFYKLMERVGYELESNTHAFKQVKDLLETPQILDLCMAPGGFLSVAMKLNPCARALGFSLPVSAGGYRVQMPNMRGVKKRFLDITMLADDMGARGVARPEHPDANNFLPSQLESGQLFDLVICCGHVSRMQHRASYREKREARRLTATQLALGIEHVRCGGTMIVLFHRVETWDNILTMREFAKFASLRLFKPTTGHAKRSSFYMVATNIQNRQTEAVEAVERWKAQWRLATFAASDEEYYDGLHVNEPTVEAVLGDFGPKLIEMGTQVWKTQADALAEASFIKNR